MAAAVELVERYDHLQRVAARLWPDADRVTAMRRVLRLIHQPQRVARDDWTARQRERTQRALEEARRVPPAVRADVLAAGRCAYCGASAPTQVDHVVPVSRGGSRRRRNLAAACNRCNLEKMACTPEEWRADREAVGLPWPPLPLLEQIRRYVAAT